MIKDMLDMDNDTLICPYCKMEQYMHEPDEVSADMCLTECEHCGRSFWYGVTVERTYFPYKDSDGELENR